MTDRGRAVLLLLAAAAAAACAGSPEAGTGETAEPPRDPLAVALEGREVVDLTHPLDGAAPYWPGAKYFPMKSWDLARFEEVRAFSRAYSIPEHYGTHVDAPAHFAPGTATMEGVAPRDLMGPAVVFDMRERSAADPDALLTAEDVDAWESIHGQVPEGAVAFLLTGWGARWGDPKAYRNADDLGRLRFPSYGLDAARRLLVDRGCRGLAIDLLSVDRGIDGEFPVHRLGNGMGRWFLENVANLERLPPSGAYVIVAPIPIRGGSGAQARVLAFLPAR